MPIEGCATEPLDQDACKAWIDYVLGSGSAPADLGLRAWVLFHCEGGVTWGRLESNTWQLACASFPHLCPIPSETSIQEMRVFSPEVEVLIWRAVHALRGRILRDDPKAVGNDALRPDDESRLLLAGQVIEYRNGFTRVSDGTGAEQVLPVRVTGGSSSAWPRLVVRHYFARDEKTGCVRVVATRLVEVK
jgi:CRISPR-associated protein (TIGR03984 family)